MRLLESVVRDDGTVDVDRWRQAHEERTPVAVCRCGAFVHTDPAEPAVAVQWERHWLSLRCACGRTAALPTTRRVKPNGSRPSGIDMTELAAERDRAILGEHG